MLVLTRTVGDGIMIGDDVEIVVLSNDGRKVRLGINAPLETPVHRREIYLAIQAQGDVGESPEPRQLRSARSGRAS
ncbi:MAG: carbon storage regulator CsrA [Solirubrobacteraceae bacterium]